MENYSFQDSLRNMEIEEAVDKLLSVQLLKKYPVPLVKIAKSLGLQVSLVENWPNNLLSILAVDASSYEEHGSVKNIFININAENFGVRRFLLAYEIAEYLLIYDGYKDFSYYGAYKEDTKEKEEDNVFKFARALLMPKNKFKHECSKIENESLCDKVNRLAICFQAPIKEVVNRLEELNILEDDKMYNKRKSLLKDK